MIFNINSSRGQTRFITCVARVTCLVHINYAGHCRSAPSPLAFHLQLDQFVFNAVLSDDVAAK